MLPPVFPLRMIVFQIIFLLTAIVLEAMVLRWNLRLPHRTSIERAASINLVTVCAGWLLFFMVEPWLPGWLREQLISYIFFNQLFVNGGVAMLPLWLIGGGVAMFFLTFLIKTQSLELLLRLLEPTALRPNPEVKQPRPDRYQSNRSRQPVRDRQETRAQANEAMILVRTRANAVLQANALSFGAIVVLLLLRTVLEVFSR